MYVHVSKNEKRKLRLGYRESNPGLLREQSLLSSESQRCYRYTIPDGVECGSDQLLVGISESHPINPPPPTPEVANIMSILLAREITCLG